MPRHTHPWAIRARTEFGVPIFLSTAVHIAVNLHILYHYDSCSFFAQQLLGQNLVQLAVSKQLLGQNLVQLVVSNNHCKNVVRNN